MKRQIHPRSGSHQLESRCGLLLEIEITPDAESTRASGAKYNIISQRLELTLFIIWLTQKVLAPMPARKRYENTQDIAAGSGCSSHDLFGWRGAPMGALQPQPPHMADMLQVRKNHRPHKKT